MAGSEGAYWSMTDWARTKPRSALLAGKETVKVIVVPKKLVNIVLR